MCSNNSRKIQESLWKINRNSKSVFYGEVLDGRMRHGEECKRYKDVLYKNLKWIRVSDEQWNQLSVDRTEWRREIKVNKSINSGQFPTAWKKSLIIPINKINKPDNFADLRPINILPVFSRIVERAIYEQIYLYFTDNILPDCQSGFRQNHSTTSALLIVTDGIIDGIDRKNVTILLSLDYNKAFDTMNNELLCAKLKYFNFNENSISLISSILSNRS